MVLILHFCFLREVASTTSIPTKNVLGAFIGTLSESACGNYGFGYNQILSTHVFHGLVAHRSYNKRTTLAGHVLTGS